MRRIASIWVLSLFIAGILSPVFAADTSAQSATPSSTDASPTPSDSVWFVIAPEGKANGEYFDVTIEPGRSTTLSGRLGNGSAIPVKAIIYAADAYSGVNGGFVLNASDEPVNAPTTWLDFPTQTVDFEPKQGIQSSFSITVPEGTPPGQYITGIAIETAEAEPMGEGSPILVKYRLATPVLITVPGEIDRSFEIGTIEATADSNFTTIDGAIENTGNIRVRPEGNLTVTDASGEVVVTSPIAMNSVYAGDTTTFQVVIPFPLPEGEYSVDVDLNDPDTKATAAVSDVAITVAKPEAPTPVTASSIDVTPMPSADNVVFAQVSTTISNTGTPIAGELTLNVFKDGEQVDSKVLATSMTIQNGDTVVEQPYIPASGTWESGTYTFQVTLTATDPTTGTEATILTADSDAEIVIP